MSFPMPNFNPFNGFNGFDGFNGFNGDNRFPYPVASPNAAPKGSLHLFYTIFDSSGII